MKSTAMQFSTENTYIIQHNNEIYVIHTYSIKCLLKVITISITM